jgi:hypothetical protein
MYARGFAFGQEARVAKVVTATPRPHTLTGDRALV